MFKSLKSHKVKIKINLEENPLGDSFFESLGEFIREKNLLKELNLRKCEITRDGLNTLAPYLVDNMGLHSLDLSDNILISNTATGILVEMTKSSRISKLLVYGTSITDVSELEPALVLNRLVLGVPRIDLASKYVYFCFFIQRFLRRNTILWFAESVFLFKDHPLFNRVKASKISSVCEVIRQYGRSIKELNMGCCDFNPETMSDLCSTLKTCPYIRKLELYLTHIDDACMDLLSDLMYGNPTIEYLHIGSSSFTDKGLATFCEALIGNTVLKTLMLKSNQSFTEASIPVLVDMIGQTCITQIDLTDTPIVNNKQVSDALEMSIDSRVIPIKSNAKSAAKSSASFF